MFQSARLKLTAWYLVLIMAISILFSLVLYRGITQEVDRSLRIQQFRIYQAEHPDALFLAPPPPMDPQVFEEASDRIKLILILINLGIFIVAGGAGYFLAGRTLKPIKEMVDEQNRFITDASHELRTPLTALRSEIEVNLRDEKLSLQNARELLSSNLEEVINLQALSDNLLQLAQRQKSNDTIKLQTITPITIIDEAIRKVASVAKEKQITLQKKRFGNYKVTGDKQSLIQLCVILLDNAVKYSAEKTTVTITTKKTDHTMLISITDEGVGIDPKDIPHIFDRFYRADMSRTKQAVSGYGLGLSIAKKIVAMHNGAITVKSGKEKGTTFTIQLPVHF
jgi:two-component system sensor histidine kinase CiaH